MTPNDITTYLVEKAALTILLALLSGCTSYAPQPLDTTTPLRTGLSELKMQMTPPPGEAAKGYAVNPEDGLDLTEIGILAVLNNPKLKALRKRWTVSGAQVFSAGLLPDPQLSAGLDKPAGKAAGLVDAWSLQLGYDIIPLITRQARTDAARKGREKIRLDLLWQEWQVIQQARSLAVRLQFETRRLELLHDIHQLYLDRYRRSARALQDGNVTLDVNGTDLTALLNALTQINQLEQARNETRHELNLLLGLEPGVHLALAPLVAPSPLPKETLANRLAHLPEVRPDLLALKAGYESQEANVRAAILAQFPSLGIGVNRARDTGGDRTTGLSITLHLPILSGNRGTIAIQRATREQLHEEYRSRLAQAEIDIDRLFSLQTILHEQQENLKTYLPHLEKLVHRARRAYARGDIGALTFLNMEFTWVNKRLERLKLTQAEWENRIALEALLALPDFPATPAAVTNAISDSAP